MYLDCFLAGDGKAALLFEHLEKEGDGGGCRLDDFDETMLLLTKTFPSATAEV